MIEHSPQRPPCCLSDADESLPTSFERTVAAHPRQTALVSDGWRPTYLDLNIVANRLAHTIVSRGGAPGDRVAILMDHDAAAIAALVSVLKAGRIVVALNRSDPSAWLRELVDDSQASLIVADAGLCDLAREIARPGCEVLAFEEHCAAGSDQNLSIEISPAEVAVLGYTSGSTGRPKAVMVTHRQLVRNVVINTEAVGYCPEDRVPLFGSLSGVAASTWTWCALLNGAALCPYAVSVKGVAGLLDWMDAVGITVFASQASVFRHFMTTLDPGAKLSRIRVVRLGGESVTSDDFRMFRAHCAEHCIFVIAFSCSETCNIAWSRRSWHDKVPDGPLSIGPISKGQEVLLLDENNRSVEPGEVGEIAVRSRYVAAGYWRNPSLTAERFSDDLDGQGSRLVRTGDLGRINSEGFLVFCGRRDDRLKIRGNRIELGGIAGAISRLLGVEQVVVEAVERTNQEAELVGFVKAADSHSWSPPKLRDALRSVLPAYMVPSSFVLLRSFPLTAIGKIDRTRLREIARERREQRIPQRPSTQTEMLLAEIWAKTFARAEIGRDDEFFDLGGDSLIAAVIAAEVYSAFGVMLDLRAFADHSVLAALAAFIDRQSSTATTDDVPLVPVSRETPSPLSFAQERAWLASQTPEGLQRYVHVNRYCIRGPLDRQILKDCLSYLAKRHEMLRTTFANLDGRPVQIVHAPESVDLPFFDLAGTADAEPQADHIFAKQAARPIDLGRLPIMRFTLVRVRENEHWLERVLHHIVTDAWSSMLYFRELSQLYGAKHGGAPPPIADGQSIQYADYAVWQRNSLRHDQGQFQETMKWWVERLAGGAPVLNLRCRRPSEMELLEPPSPADGVFRWGIDPSISDRLSELGRAEGSTRFAVRLAVFVALLASETGQRDILLGTYVNNRNRIALQSVFGLFVNIIVLRFFVKLESSFRDWLVVVRTGVAEGEARSSIPFEMICEELERRGIGRPPVEIIFQVTQNDPEWTIADLKMTRMEPKFEAMPWGFSMSPDVQSEQHDCRISFDANLYDPVGVRAFVGRYRRLLAVASSHPDKTLEELLDLSQSNDAKAS